LSQARVNLTGIDGAQNYLYVPYLVISGKLTTTDANKIRFTSMASGSVVSGNIVSGVVFSDATTNNFSNEGIRSGNIASGQVGRVHFANETILSGNIGSGVINFPTFFGDAIAYANVNVTSGSVILSGQIDKIHFGEQIAAGTARGGNQGYILGGYSTNYTAIADKTTYASDTTASQTTANLTTSTAFSAGVSEGSTKGYVAGGDTTSYVATAYKTTFATDSTATQSSANLSQARTYLAGCSGEGTKGYFAGGSTVLGGGSVATANKIIYSTDTTSAQTTANLSQARYYLAGITEGSTKGYFLGGNTGGGAVLTTDKLTFATDATAAQTSANLPAANYGLTGNSGNDTRGYVSGQAPGTATTRKITYATDTTSAATNAFLSSFKYAATGITQGSTKGYVAGGFDDYNPQNTADKITFSSDTTAAQTTANLSQARYGAAGVEQYLTATAAVNNFSVNSGKISSGTIGLTTASGQNAAFPYNLAETAQINTNQPMFDYFVFQEQCSGIKAVCIASGSRVVRAQRASGMRLPAIGVTSGTVNSGATGIVYYYGYVGRTGTFAQNSGLYNGISGFQGKPVYVGSGGNIVNLSGFWVGGVQQQPFISGDMQQQIGIAMSGGLFVMPSPRVVRSGFQGILPYNHPA
jgi:hypothetical protein